MTNTIEQAWLAYRADIVPHNASDVQIVECRRAFYAGAAVVLLSAAVPHPDPVVDGMLQEVKDFAEAQVR